MCVVLYESIYLDHGKLVILHLSAARYHYHLGDEAGLECTLPATDRSSLGDGAAISVSSSDITMHAVIRLNYVIEPQLGTTGVATPYARTYCDSSAQHNSAGLGGDPPGGLN
jgi:hypothetical protein